MLLAAIFHHQLQEKTQYQRKLPTSIKNFKLSDLWSPLLYDPKPKYFNMSTFINRVMVQL